MAKKIPKQVDLIKEALNTTGLTVVLMTPEDLEARIPSQYRNMYPKTYLSAYEMAPKMDLSTIGKRQLVVVYDEEPTDSNGKPTGKSVFVVKLFDKINNLTTMDPAQIKVGSSYISRHVHRLENDEAAMETFSKNILDHLMSFRKMIDDPAIVK